MKSYLTGYADPVDYELFISRKTSTLPVYKGKVYGFKKISLQSDRYFVVEDNGGIIIIRRKRW